MKVKEILKEGKTKLIENQIEEASLIARVLLQFVLKCGRSELILKQEQEIEKQEQIQYEEAINKILQGIPLQYITNSQEFYGLNFYVDENVLIPQSDTEVLVEEVIKLAQLESKTKILDICTGSGVIGICLAHYINNAELTLSDVSDKALNIANKNAEANMLSNRIKIINSNMFEKINGKFDIIVSNPPYIETKTISTLSKQVNKEPKLALDGGEDGLDFYRILINESKEYLNENGYLCMEIGYDQKEKVINLIKETKEYKNIYSKQDLAGNDRIIICQKDSNL